MIRRVLLYGFLVGLALFTMAPFLWLLSTSLEGGDLLRLESWRDFLPNRPTLEAYPRVLEALPEFPRFFLNSLLVCAGGVGLELLLASLAAYPLARMEFPGKNLLSAALLATLMLPAQANMIVNFVTIRHLGLFDNLVAVFLPSAVSVFGIFLMRQAFLVIPRELEEAARIDGCGDLWIWCRILLPLSRPALGALALFSFVAHWNSFLWPLVVMKSREWFPLSVGLAFMSSRFDSEFRLVAAGSVLATLPVILLFLALQRYFIRGVPSGAVH